MKKFKNTFGVTGTQTEIDLFIKEVEKLGWKHQPYHGISVNAIFLNSNIKNIDLKIGCFWRSSNIGSTTISLSTLSGWNKAVELASEEEEEIPEYVECINKNAYNLTENKIYSITKACR